MGWEVVVRRRVVIMVRMTNRGWERIISCVLFFCYSFSGDCYETDSWNKRSKRELASRI
jgi:hypothetical protein